MADANIRYKVSQVGAEKVASSFQKIGSSIALAFGGLIAITGLIRLTKHLKNTARDAEETRQKFAVVFSEIGQGAEDVADAFSKEFLLAGASTRELLGNTGDLLVGFGFTERAALNMSREVNSLAQDLASFTNFAGGAMGASLALTKALVGETESVKALGIVIRQTTPEFIKNVKILQETRGVTLLQAKAIEILRIAYEQSSKSIGDFQRTQESLANQERILDEQLKDTSETLGNELVPAFLLATKTALFLTKSIMGMIRAASEIGTEGKGIVGEFTANGILSAEQLQKVIKRIEKLRAEGKKIIIGPDLQRQLDDFKAINESVSRTLGEVEGIKIEINAAKVALDAWKGPLEGYTELLLELKTLQDKLKLPITEVTDELVKQVSALDQLKLRLHLIKLEHLEIAKLTGAVEGREGIGGVKGGKFQPTGLAPLFKKPDLLKQAAKTGETIFDGWANILTSNMNTAWAEIFGEANSLFEQLVNSMVDLLVKNVFTGLLNFASGGFAGPIGGILSLFGSPAPSGGGQTTIIVELGGRPLGEMVLDGNKEIQRLRLV